MTDRRTVTLVVAGLAVYGLVGALGAIVLAFAGKAVPGELWQSSGVAIGALAAVLAHTGSAPPEPAPGEPKQPIASAGGGPRTEPSEIVFDPAGLSPVSGTGHGSVF